MGYHLRAEAAAGPREEGRATRGARTPRAGVGSGYRYYSPGLGRWINRDPIGDRAFTSELRKQHVRVGRLNGQAHSEPKYVFAQNRGNSALDYLGLITVRPSGPVSPGVVHRISALMQQGYDRYIGGIREPLKSAIADLWPRYMFVVDHERIGRGAEPGVLANLRDHPPGWGVPGAP